MAPLHRGYGQEWHWRSNADAIPTIPRAVQLATEAQLRSVLARLAPEDRAEVEAFGDDAAIITTFHSSVRSWCALLNGEPMLVAGVKGDGTAWMMTTPDWRRDRKFYLRATRQIVNEMQAMFPVLRTSEAADRPRELRWLRWLGFVLEPPVEIAGHLVCFAERRM